MRAAWNAHDVNKPLAVCADDIVWRDVASPTPYPDVAGLMMQLGLMSR